ncbi:MAG TPA: hypothetical protein VF403_19785 [Kofleriaceae bacterium]
MATRGLLVAAMAICVAACSPFGGGGYSCERDDQCSGGTCSAGFCSVTDSSCSSGLRYGDSAGGLSNTCVAGPIDANIDSKEFHDAPPPGVTCFGTGFGKTCFARVPSAPMTLDAQQINTDSSLLCATKVETNPPWCVIAASDLKINAGTLSAIGNKPLVLLATGTMTIDGSIDVASQRGGQQGAASNDPLQCDAGTPPGNNGGGAGGSFGGVGGHGGNGGGVPGATKPTNAMRGGCPGQDGKSGTFGVKGLGGGVVYLIAGTKITLGGNINASGAGGSAGVTGSAGAGGGGSGGLIGLDSPMVTNGGAIFANGGGGAEGSGLTSKGNDGTESVNGAVADVSGSASTIGGDGGAGGASGAATNGADGTGGGGGGGGGGVGAVKLFQAASITGGVVSPPPS